MIGTRHFHPAHLSRVPAASNEKVTQMTGSIPAALHRQARRKLAKGWPLSRVRLLHNWSRQQARIMSVRVGPSQSWKAR